MYSNSLMSQSCSLGGAKAAAGQPALGKQVTAAGAERQVPALHSPSPGQQEAVLSVSQWAVNSARNIPPASEGPPGPAQAVPMPLHGGWPEDADIPATPACAWSILGAAGMQAHYQSFETQGLRGV